MFKRTGGGFALVLILTACCLVVLKDFPDNVKTGIDLEGGTELTYGIDLGRVPAVRRGTALEEVRSILQNRFDQFGIKEISITQRGHSSLVIQVPETDDEEIERIKEGIRRAGTLSIHLVDSTTRTPEELQRLKDEWAQYEVEWSENEDRIARGEPGRTDLKKPSLRVIPLENKDGSTSEIVIKTEDGQWIGGDHLTDAYPTRDKFQLPAVGFTFDAPGAAAFAELTGNNINKELAMVLDGVGKSRATIQDRISNQGVLTGSFTEEEVKTIVTLLRSGSLPVAPEFDSESRIGAQLGEESVQHGTQAMLIGFVLVLIFMVVYYSVTLGGVATVSLLYNLMLVLTLLIVFRNNLTLPGLAGLLLTVGMSVDANILIFERIREERARGRGLTQSITAGYGRAFSTIFDANLTTLITAYILFNFGTGPVKGFAIVLSIGIITSFFSALYVSRLLLTWLVNSGVVKDFRMLKVVDNPNLDFLSVRRTAISISTFFIAIGLVTLMARGTENLGIDFTGGTRMVINMKNVVAEADVRDAISGIGEEYKDVQIQGRDDVDGKATQYSVRTRMVLERDVSNRDEAARRMKEAFKTKIEEALAARGFLAPHAITEEKLDTSAQTFTAVVHVKAAAGGSLSAKELEDVLRAGGYPVAFVKTAPGGGGTGVWSAFTIASEATPDAAKLHSRLANVLRDSSSVDLADPFAEVDTIGSRVAQDMQGKVFIAMVLAFMAIIFYISLRFQLKFGLAAIAALLHDIFFTLGALAIGDALLGDVLNLKINLPVVAALLTVVGYSLNDTIVIFDRIRENLVDKKRDVDYAPVINTSINSTLSRTILTSLTTFIVVLILLIWGGEAVQGFAFALCVGVVVGTYSSMYIASPALMFFHARSEARRAQLLAEAEAASTA